MTYSLGNNDPEWIYILASSDDPGLKVLASGFIEHMYRLVFATKLQHVLVRYETVEVGLRGTVGFCIYR